MMQNIGIKISEEEDYEKREFLLNIFFSGM